MTDYIWHVALGVGMGTRETRAHLTDADLDATKAHIDRALVSPAGDPIPGRPGYRLSARHPGGILLATVGREIDQTGLCTIAVVTRSHQGARAWRGLHEGYPQFAASLGDVPRTPYCAVRAEYGLMLDPVAGAWLDAYQITLAWAWVERKGTT